MRTSAQVTVGVGEMAVSADPEETLVTYALGSCLGVAAWDRVARVGGLLHFMLPSSLINPPKAQAEPAMFGDTGLPLFLEKLFALGATRKNLVMKLAGGAAVSGNDIFEIGKRNCLLARRVLWKNALAPAAEETGGKVSRTLRLELASGKVSLKDPEGEREL